MKNEINACLPQVLGIVVSVCMAHGWQLEAETGLQVSLCVFLCACYCVLCASVWRKWLAVDSSEIGPQVCICVVFGVCVQVFVLPGVRWGLSVFDFVCVSVSQCLFKTHGWKLELAMEPRARERVVVVVWICHVIMCIICLYVCFWVGVWALSTHEWLEDKTI